MRRAWLPLGLVVLAGVVGPLACGEAFTSTGGTGGASSSTGDATSNGGATSSGVSASTSTTVTSTATGGPECMISADCPGDNTVCGEPICVKGNCGTLTRQGDVKSSSQIYGDCQDIVCLKGQVKSSKNDNDFYDDGNDCTDDTCDNGGSVSKPRGAGAPCGSMGSGKICDGAGACVVCNEAKDCKNGLSCHAGLCSPDSCVDGLVTVTSMPPETDKDCGGPCAPCGTGMRCSVGADCASNICKKQMGDIYFKCVAPTCGDGVKNGSEPTKDCGGPDCALKCEAGDHCLLATDCADGVCVGSTCAAPSCTDAVMNGTEAGIDCGANCGTCPP